MFLIPERIREFFRKRREKTKRSFSLDREFTLALRDTAEKQGRTEDEILYDFARSGQEQFLRDTEMESRWDSLSGREQEVLALVCMGRRNDEIALMLGISQQTVKTHLHHIFFKFGMHRRELRLALQNWHFEQWWQERHR